MGLLRKALAVSTFGASTVVVHPNSPKQRERHARRKLLDAERREIETRDQAALTAVELREAARIKPGTPADELIKLDQLRRAGTLTQEQFTALVDRLVTDAVDRPDARA